MVEHTELPFQRIKREVLIKKNAKTSDKFGKDPSTQTMPELLDNGIIVVNKPAGPTSHQVSAYVRKILNLSKTGHSGTLDPNVTGALPVALGTGTKIVQALLPAGKEYVCLMHLHKEINPEKILQVCNSYVGRIKQLPPIKSSVKRQWRERKVYYLSVLEIEGQEVLFRVGCQAGTYIRKLCHDIGTSLGCGAHMSQLIRTKVAVFNDEEMYSLQDITDAYYYYKEEQNDKYLRQMIKHLEVGVTHLPKIWVLDSTVNTLCHGASLKMPGISKLESDICPGDLVAVMTLKNELVTLGRARMTSKEMLNEERGVAIVSERVFMNPGVYPKIDMDLKEE